MPVTALILAAGSGTRVGGHKATLPVTGVPLLRRQVECVRSAGLQQIVVVIDAAHAGSAALAAALNITVVANDDPARGQSHSVRLGMTACPSNAVLLFPVDHAWTTPADVAALLAAHAQHPQRDALIFRPHCGADFGHPVLFGADFRALFLALEANAPASSIAKAYRRAVIPVTVANVNIARDIDTLEDLARCEADHRS